MRSARQTCPVCGANVAPPLRCTLLGPLLFGEWPCQTCHSPLRFRVLPFYLCGLVALLVGLVGLAPLHLVGLHDSLWSLAVLPVIGAVNHWLAVRFAAVYPAL